MWGANSTGQLQDGTSLASCRLSGIARCSPEHLIVGSVFQRSQAAKRPPVAIESKRGGMGHEQGKPQFKPVCDALNWLMQQDQHGRTKIAYPRLARSFQMLLLITMALRSLFCMARWGDIYSRSKVG